MVDLLLRVVEPLDEPLHDVAEVVLILTAQHAYQVDDLLHKCWILEVDALNESNENVLISVNQIGLEILEKHDIPIYDDFSCISLFFVYHDYILVSSEFVLELFENVLEVILVLHNVQNQLEHLFVYFLDQILKLPFLAINQYDFNNIGKLLLEHLVEKCLLLLHDELVLVRQVLSSFIEDLL